MTFGSKVALALVSAAFLSGAVSGNALAQGKTMTVGLAAQDLQNLDPYKISTTTDRVVVTSIFNGLLRFKPGTADAEHLEPDLAETWNPNSTKTEWTLNLRKGVQCQQNFGEFTSEDVVYSLQRAADPARSSFSTDFADFDKVEAVDPYTVKITLKRPMAGFLPTLANINGGMMLCKKAVEQLGAEFSRRPVGTGPFEFAEWKPQQSVRLVANKKYFRGAPQLDTVVYRYLQADASRDLAFTSGELDMVYGRRDDAWIKRVRGEGGIIVSLPPGEQSNLYLNTKSAPLDNLKVRQAILYALDREVLVKFQGTEANKLAISVIPSSNIGVVDLKLPKHDVAKAKALLAEAGYPNGVTIKAITHTLPTTLRAMQALQETLRQANITIDLVVVDTPTFHQQVRQNLSQMVWYGAGRFPIPDTYLTQFYHSRASVGTPTGVTNFSLCSAADQEIEQARNETDLEKQKVLWGQAQRKIMDAVCAVPILETYIVWAHTKNVELGHEAKADPNQTLLITEKTRLLK